MFVGRPGIGGLLKEGGRHFSGLDEATFRNIEACRKLSSVTRSSFGPESMSKLIVNHIGKQFVTSDAATITEQMEVQHPAAKLLAMASKMQEQMCGDATNLVLLFAGELLHQASLMLSQGLHCTDIVKGYNLALRKFREIITAAEVPEHAVKDVTDAGQLETAIFCTLSSKQLSGSGGCLAGLVAQAAVKVMPSNASGFLAENIRVAKLTGGSLSQSYVVPGIVSLRDCSGTVKNKKNIRVMVLSCGLEMTSTEAKGTVLISDAQELLNFSLDEENKIRKMMADIRDAGVEAIIVGGSISDMALHFCDALGILVLKCQSKFELRRICQTLGAVALVQLATPTTEELGYAEEISVEEISSKQITIIKSKDTKVATIVLRCGSPSVLDEAERAVVNGARCVQNLTRDNRFVAGGGAFEIEASLALQSYGSTVVGLEQYSTIAFGEAFDIVPRVIAGNCGFNATEVLTLLYGAHRAVGAPRSFGVDSEAETEASAITDVLKMHYPLLDHLHSKLMAIELATDAAISILKVDQIIMSRPAGGPKPPQAASHWDED